MNMSKSKRWDKDYSYYPESDKGLQEIGEILVQVVLMLGVLCLVYTFFDKTELEPFSQSSGAEQSQQALNH
jgi:hypothetical protein